MKNSNKKSLISKLFVICVLGIFTISLVAPFTFLKPKNNAVDGNVSADRSNVIVEPVELPLHQVALPDFGAIRDIKAKKTAFFNFIRPAILKRNNEILAKRSKIENYLALVSLETSLTDEQLTEIDALSVEYKINKSYSVFTKLNRLHSKVDTVPTSLVLVQAANESAWGTSRFAKIGLNFFGIWCYREGCGMVPKGRNNGARHEVAAFQSVDEAVSRYFKNINTHNAYMILRTIRAQLRAQDEPLKADILATGLIPYSERGVEYVLDINTMLRQNQAYFKSEKEVTSS